MRNNYLEQYVDLEGNVSDRNLVQQISIKTFAAIKFFSDRILAIIGLIVASPLMLIIAILIKLDSNGPVFFKQLRTGKYGKEFYMYKFRTMEKNNDVHDLSKADQHTRIGTFLRKTSLDEIPQLINILKGEMSFIGPRPWIPDYYEVMNEAQRFRNIVRPGITGLAQTRGRNDIDIFKKIEYDLDYIKYYSLWMDLIVVTYTFIAVFGAKGADAGKNNIERELNDLKKQNKISKNI
ncbi:MAG: sugar transferase [Bacilli bacterium]|nr:sugar transferase [Bacilli bacterium]MBR6137148.1 sugar transferase [Bacilli bacterium]